MPSFESPESVHDAQALKIAAAWAKNIHFFFLLFYLACYIPTTTLIMKNKVFEKKKKRFAEIAGAEVISEDIIILRHQPTFVFIFGRLGFWCRSFLEGRGLESRCLFMSEMTGAEKGGGVQIVSLLISDYFGKIFLVENVRVNCRSIRLLGS